MSNWDHYNECKNKHKEVVNEEFSKVWWYSGRDQLSQEEFNKYFLRFQKGILYSAIDKYLSAYCFYEEDAERLFNKIFETFVYRIYNYENTIDNYFAFMEKCIKNLLKDIYAENGPNPNYIPVAVRGDKIHEIIYVEVLARNLSLDEIYEKEELIYGQISYDELIVEYNKVLKLLPNIRQRTVVTTIDDPDILEKNNNSEKKSTVEENIFQEKFQSKIQEKIEELDPFDKRVLFMMHQVELEAKEKNKEDLAPKVNLSEVCRRLGTSRHYVEKSIKKIKQSLKSININNYEEN